MRRRGGGGRERKKLEAEFVVREGLSPTVGHRSSNSSSSGHPGCESAILQTSIFLIACVDFYIHSFCIINLVHTLTAFLLY